jgi:hypothetical protein
MTTLTGSIIEVSTVPLGDTLVGDHAAGVTVLTVNAIVDFEGAGSVMIVDDSTDPGTEHVLGIVSIDTEAQTITLDGPTPVALLDDAFVAVVPAGEEKQAQVLVDGSDEAITCRVPHGLYGYLADGIRDPGAEESVEIADDGGEWSVVDVLGVTPVLDGGTIDPGTLEPAPNSDGVAPADPTVVTFVGGIGSVFFRWTEVVNADPVTYRLHVVDAPAADPAPTVPTDGTAEVFSGDATAAAVRKLADGSTIVADGSVKYYGVVTVEDADGPGPDSNVASGVPAQVNTPDIAVGALTADLLTANDAIIDALNATDFTTVTMTGPTIQTSVSGPRLLLGEEGAGGIISFFTGEGAESAPGLVDIDVFNSGAANVYSRLQLLPARMKAASDARPNISLESASANTERESTIRLHAQHAAIGEAGKGRIILETGVVHASGAIRAVGNKPVTDEQTTDAALSGTGNVTLAGLSITMPNTNPESVAAGNDATTRWKVTLCADCQLGTAGTLVVELLVNGAVTSGAIVLGGAINTRLAQERTWIVEGLASGNHVFTARARMSAAGQTGTVRGSGQTTMIVERVS